jgi:hypothetical protein
MEFPDLLPKPTPSLEGLPTELCTQICLATDSSGGILDTTSLLNLSFTSKTMYDKAESAFLKRVLTSPKFSLTPWSLHMLAKISKDEILRRHVKVLEFGPELLNTSLEEDFQEMQRIGLVSRRGSWPMWPLVQSSEKEEVQLFVFWGSRDGHSEWVKNYQDYYKRLCIEQEKWLEHRESLAGIIARFPNLKTVRLDPRPVGPTYQQSFGTYIPLSIGTKSLGRAIGGLDMYLAHETPPKGSQWLSHLSVDGYLLTERGKELDMFPCLFKALSNNTLNHIKLDMVIPGLQLSRIRAKPFHTTDNSWLALAHQVRSITWDLNGWNFFSDFSDALRGSSWARRMLASVQAIEHLYARNAYPLRRCAPNVLGRLCLSSTTWTTLKTFHLFNMDSEGDLLWLFLHLHKTTLENVHFHKVFISDTSRYSWKDIFEMLKGMEHLQQLTIDELAVYRDANEDWHGMDAPTISLRDVPLLEAQEGQLWSLIEGFDHRSLRPMIDLATESMIYVLEDALVINGMTVRIIRFRVHEVEAGRRLSRLQIVKNAGC